MEGQSFKPISENHSISRAIANLFVPQRILKPQFIFDKIRKENSLINYQRKSLTEAQTINIINNIPNTSKEFDGFIFEEFNSKGKSTYMFRVKNEPNRTQINLENRDYTNWEDFKTKLTDAVDCLSIAMPIFVEGISLTYIDEFVWLKPSNIEVKSILDENSELLNKDFFNSYNGTLVLLSQSEPKDDVSFEEQKTEIIFNNIIKRVIINHSLAVKFKEVTVYDPGSKESFISYFNQAHIANKNILKRILRDDVQQLINL